MIERKIVRRYAMALFNAASKQDVIDRVESDLGMITYALESSKKLADVIASPLISAPKKQDIIRDIFKDKLHEITLSYFLLLLEKRRQEAIYSTEEEYLWLANEARGIVRADITTAVKLNEDEEVNLVRKLEKYTGKKIHLAKTILPSIIGGVVVKIGDREIDGSIRGELSDLREKLLG